MNNFSGLQEPKTEWNLSSEKILLIGNLQRRGVECLTRGNILFYGKAFTYWKTIRILINNRIPETSKAKVKKLEEKIWTDSIKHSTNSVGEKQKNEINWTKFGMYLEEYIECVNDLIREVGLDIKEQGEESLF